MRCVLTCPSASSCLLNNLLSRPSRLRVPRVAPWSRLGLPHVLQLVSCKSSLRSTESTSHDMARDKIYQAATCDDDLANRALRVRAFFGRFSLFFSQRTLAGLAASSVERHARPCPTTIQFPCRPSSPHPRSRRVRKDDTYPFSQLGLREPRRARSRRDETRRPREAKHVAPDDMIWTRAS